jgi:hypothetical protein
VALVALRDRDDETEVRVDHELLRLAVAPLDALGELDFLFGSEQLVAAGLIEEELERVRGRVRQIAVHVGRVWGIGARAVVLQLDPPPLDLIVQRLDVIVVEVELAGDLVDQRVLDATLFLAFGEECFHLCVHHLRISRPGVGQTANVCSIIHRWRGPSISRTRARPRSIASLR